MRRIRNPESYVPPKEAAQLLRNIASDLDKREEDAWVAIRINSSFATRAEVEHALSPKSGTQATRRSK